MAKGGAWPDQNPATVAVIRPTSTDRGGTPLPDDVGYAPGCQRSEHAYSRFGGIGIG